MQQWVIAAFAVFGAFVACGFAAAAIAWQFRWWDTPLAGFCAAFAAVWVTYLSAPSRKCSLAGSVLAFGSVIAWFALDSSYYPEIFPSLAYQPTRIPFIATVIGGVLGLVLACSRTKGNSNGA
jgi:hypothetical protein